MNCTNKEIDLFYFDYFQVKIYLYFPHSFAELFLHLYLDEIF